MGPAAFVATSMALSAATAARRAVLNDAVTSALAAGHARVAGVDEAGAGALAGPVVAAAVAMHGRRCAPLVAGLDDSKRLTPASRVRVFDAIMAQRSLGVAVAIVSAYQVDQLNVLNARLRAMATAVAALPYAAAGDAIALGDADVPELKRGDCDYDDDDDDDGGGGSGGGVLFVDGDRSLPGVHAEWQQTPVVGGDATISVVAAASIVAKVVRDRYMTRLAQRFPQYGFDVHAGYATKAHKQSLEQFGPCPQHRFSYRPVREAAALQAALIELNSEGEDVR